MWLVYKGTEENFPDGEELKTHRQIFSGKIV